MPSRAAGRRATLFILTLILPCLVLSAVGVHLLREGAELARVRAADEHRRRLSDIGVRLMARLERVKFDEATAIPATLESGAIPIARDASALWLGRVQHGRLLLPWDVDPAASHLTRFLIDGPFAEAIRAGDRFEMITTQSAAAADSYAKAKALAPDAAAADYAEFLQARALVKCRCPEDARVLYTRVLKSKAKDDQGIPLAFYAGERLLALGASGGPVLNRIDAELLARRPLAPAAVYLARAVVSSIADSGSSDQRERAVEPLARIAERIDHVERLLRLQRDWPALAPVSRDGHAVWVPFDGQWLISTVTSPIAGSLLAIAVQSGPMFDAVNAELSDLPAAGVAHFSTTGDDEPVGASFPSLRVSISGTPPDDAMRAWGFQRAFYITAVVAVLGIALVGGAFFWRDLRRDVRTAEMRSQFVASVSHELRTPLTAIRMFAETLQMEQPLPDTARAEYVRTIVSESERLTRLVNNVLDFSKIERGEKVYRLEPGELPRAIQRAVAAMQYPLAGHGFDLRLDVDADLPQVRFDADAIQQAVMNLLSNAMKYSGESRRIEVRAAAVGGDAVIWVTDHGLGISAANRGRIFDRFYRAAVPENAQIPGAGLGLSLVDHIVRGHGGRVEVTSEVGQGSTFSIHLPAAPAPPVSRAVEDGRSGRRAWRLRSAR